VLLVPNRLTLEDQTRVRLTAFREALGVNSTLNVLTADGNGQMTSYGSDASTPLDEDAAKDLYKYTLLRVHKANAPRLVPFAQSVRDGNRLHVLLLDECHWGTAATGALSNFFLHCDDFLDNQHDNMASLFVSATPYSHFVQGARPPKERTVVFSDVVNPNAKGILF
jgi:hypothetical protein